MLRFFIAIATLLWILPVAAQQENDSATLMPRVELKQWTLERCIDYAKEQNLTLKRDRLNAKSAQIDLHTAKMNRMPSVSFSTNQNFANRPFSETVAMVNGSDVVTTNSKNSYSGSYNLSASLPIYDGGQTGNNIKLQEINTKIAELNLSADELSIEEQITKLYVQIMYSMEAITTDQSQIALSEKQVERAQALFNSGLLNRADVAQLQSQLASDRYQLITDQTTCDDYKLQMKQLLELDGDYDFEILTPELSDSFFKQIPSKSQVYNAALLNRPELRVQELALDKNDLDIKIAKAGMLPTINLSAGVSSNNVTGNGNMFTQLKNQWNNVIGVNVNVPIYDKGKVRDAVAKARLNRETTQLTIEDTRKSIYKTIETYWLNANSAVQRYEAAREKTNAAQASYDLTSEQFRLGLKNIVELMTDKTNLMAANQQMLQAKYMAVLNKYMLDFYSK